MLNLRGKTVLVTGASRGIGAAIAHQAADAGASLILHATAAGEAIDAVAHDRKIPASRVIFEDLSAPDAGFRLVEKALAAASRIDAIVNNAGIFIDSSLRAPRGDWREAWAKTQAVNVQAPADIC